MQNPSFLHDTLLSVWLQDGTMIKSEDREQGATYFLEDPTLEPGLLPYTKRLQLSNQWYQPVLCDSMLFYLKCFEGH